jgi:hypothetical protein
MDDQRLKKFYTIYIVGALAFTITLSSAVVAQRYSSEMKDTVERLETLGGSSVKVRRATESARQTVEKLKKHVPPGYLSAPVENVIFQAVDTIRDRGRSAEILVESLQDKGDEMALPITIKGTLADYSGFLKMVTYLESIRFPFFSAAELTMSHETDKAPCYELKGSMRAPRIAETPDKQPAAGRSR